MDRSILRRPLSIRNIAVSICWYWLPKCVGYRPLCVPFCIAVSSPFNCKSPTNWRSGYLPAKGKKKKLLPEQDNPSPVRPRTIALLTPGSLFPKHQQICTSTYTGFLETGVNTITSFFKSVALSQNPTKLYIVSAGTLCNVTQIRGQNPVFFVRLGVAVGAARRFVGHTRLWLKGREKRSA